MTGKDTRVWRYRKGEARIFASLDDVPGGEGWVDSPAKVVDVQAPHVDDSGGAASPSSGAPPRKRGRPRKVESNGNGA